MTDFRLTPDDKATGLWVRLRAHLEDRLSRARARNDTLLPEYETALLRGEIKCLKYLLAMSDSRPIVTGEDDAP